MAEHPGGIVLRHRGNLDGQETVGSRFRIWLICIKYNVYKLGISAILADRAN
jgi:hypothetical protein